MLQYYVHKYDMFRLSKRAVYVIINTTLYSQFWYGRGW